VTLFTEGVASGDQDQTLLVAVILVAGGAVPLLERGVNAAVSLGNIALVVAVLTGIGSRRRCREGHGETGPENRQGEYHAPSQLSTPFSSALQGV
jgi:hypothetical protein